MSGLLLPGEEGGGCLGGGSGWGPGLSVPEPPWPGLAGCPPQAAHVAPSVAGGTPSTVDAACCETVHGASAPPGGVSPLSDMLLFNCFLR